MAGYILFDFDGVIHNSLQAKGEAFVELLNTNDSELKSKVYDYHLANGGMNRIIKIKNIYEQFLNISLSDQELQDLLLKFEKLVQAKLLDSPLMEGVEDFIKTLHERNKILMIVSAAPKAEIEAILEKYDLKKYFVKICGGPTSKSEHMKDILLNYSAEPKDYIFFGDSNTDKKAADEFNIPFVAINWSGSILDKTVPRFENFTNIKI